MTTETLNNNLADVKESTDLIIDIKAENLTAYFIKLENEIRQANKSFLIIGKNLTLINEGKLYADRNFGTFELYVSTIFDFTRDYAYKIMNATRIYNMLADHFIDTELPRTETHCRPLCKIETDEEIIKIWKNVVTTGKYTAKTVIEMVNVHLGKGEAVKPPVSPEIIVVGDAGGLENGCITDALTAEQKVIVLEAEIVKLNNELEKARSATFDIAKTKMAREMIQKGFAVLVATATDSQKAELIATKKSLMG